jgi:hypothetical protein
MFFELMGTVLAGLAAALLVFAVRRFAPNMLPKWLIPAAAGVAMIAATISNEYGWYNRAASTMPPGFVVAKSISDPSPFRPWTYVVPLTNRYVAVDQNSVRTNAAAPEKRIVELYFYGRWAAITNVPVIFDCAEGRTANLIDGVEFDADGMVANADWSNIAKDDPVFQTACGIV